MDILMGLLAAVCWGFTDFLIGRSARIFGVKQSVLIGQVIGLLVLSCLLLVSAQGFRFLFETELASLSLGVIAAVLGSVAIVTVISTLSGGVAAVLAYLAYRERLTILQLSGISLVLVGAMALHWAG